MDITAFTDSATELGVAVAAVGAAVVGIYAATKTFGFITAWIGKAFGAGKGRAGT